MLIKQIKMKKNVFLIAILFSLTSLTFAQNDENIEAELSSAVEKAIT